jgi:hypothetical protein
VAAVLNGPRGVQTIVRGRSDFIPGATAFVFPAQPQVPLTNLVVTLTQQIYINLNTCGNKTIYADFVGWSGAERTVSDTYRTTGFNCEYARPKAATPVTVRLVPSYKQCTSANGTHGAPLASPSCNPPVLTSNSLTIGSPDSNGQAANSTGDVILKVVGESPIDPNNGDQADLEITADLTDVRNQSDLTDYTGELRAVLPLRVTDRNNEPGNSAAATVTDTPLGFPVPCSATDGPEGGSCQVSTTVDAVMPGIATEGKRAIWRLGQVQVFDGGPDGDADTADNTLFAVQGAFAP